MSEPTQAHDGHATRSLDVLKAFIRLGPTERRDLLLIIRADCPGLWREMEATFAARLPGAAATP